MQRVYTITSHKPGSKVIEDRLDVEIDSSQPMDEARLAIWEFILDDLERLEAEGE